MYKKVLYSFSFLFYVFFLLILFAHLLFPEKKGANFLSGLIEEKYGIDFSVQSLEPVFPFNLRINNLEISSGRIKNLKIDELMVSPSVLGLLSGKLKFKINAKAFGGKIDSDIAVGLLSLTDKFFLDLSFENINLNETKNFFGPDLMLAGKAGGRIKIDYSEKKGDFSSLINLENFDLVSELVIVPVSVFEISRAEIKGEISGDDILLKDSVIRSKAGFASFNGQLMNIERVNRARADLTGKIVPDPEYILRNRDNPAMSMILPVVQNRKNMEFTVKGNLLNPMVRFK
jgi:type II secretion system protein N